ncbi:hypothetical protein AKJ16_DCAP07033 [Drosera capensis]
MVMCRAVETGLAITVHCMILPTSPLHGTVNSSMEYNGRPVGWENHFNLRLKSRGFRPWGELFPASSTIELTFSSEGRILEDAYEGKKIRETVLEFRVLTVSLSSIHVVKKLAGVVVDGPDNTSAQNAILIDAIP